MRFCPKCPWSVKYKKCSQDARKMQKFLHFRKVHARTYKKHIYHFFISPIVAEISPIEGKSLVCYSPLSGIFICLRCFLATLKLFKVKGITQKWEKMQNIIPFWMSFRPHLEAIFEIFFSFLALSPLLRVVWP